MGAIAVAVMNRVWGAPPWRRENIAAPQLKSPAWPEAAVIGGGLTGASAAYHLARRGLRTILLEAGSFGDGASGRTGGLALEGTAAGVVEDAGDCLSTLAAIVREERIDCGLLLPGCWEIAHRGEGVELPWNDEGGRLRIVRTVVGGTVDPAALLFGLLRAAIRAGAEIYERTPVLRIVTRPAPALEVPGATISPGAVVVAANAWIGELMPPVRAGMRSALTFACATERLNSDALIAIGLESGLPFYTVDTPYLWGRATADGRVIFGSGLVYGAAAQLERIDVGAGEAKLALDRLEARVRGLNPALARIRIVARWAGPIGITDDHMPILCRMPGAPATLIAGGYSGHGVAMSVTAGRMAAEAIADGAPLPAWGAPLR